VKQRRGNSVTNIIIPLFIAPNRIVPTAVSSEKYIASNVAHRRRGHTDRTVQYQVLGTPIGAVTPRRSTP
jgi:hypothetical protein